jgi:hypothetical protein
MFLHTTPNNLNHSIAGITLAIDAGSGALGTSRGATVDGTTDCGMVWGKTQIQTAVRGYRVELELDLDADANLVWGIVARAPRNPSLRSQARRPLFEPALRG